MQIFLDNSFIELRPVTYSFCNVLKINDVRRLLLATFLRQMSGTMCYALNLDGWNPLSERTYYFYVVGGAFSFFVIAVLSNRVYGRRNKFVPLFVWITICLTY